MASLNQVIAALRREIDAALEEHAVPGGPIRLEPERVVLSLEVSVREQSARDGSVEVSFDVIETGASAEKGQTHRLTFEFKSVPSSSSHVASKPATGRRKAETAPAKPPRLDAEDAGKAIESLSSVFGPPGFDSSARATVFREAFAGLAEPQAAALIASFTSGNVPDDDVTLRNAHHRISGVFRSGPLRSIERGSEILAEVLSQYELEPVVHLIEEKWKTQQDWLAEDAAPRRSKP